MQSLTLNGLSEFFNPCTNSDHAPGSVETIYQYTLFKGNPSSSKVSTDIYSLVSGSCINVSFPSFSFPRSMSHQYPDPTLLPKVQVDRGAIRFLLAGAHMMCPGFTSAGGYLPPSEEALPAGTSVAIFAEGKEHPIAVGITKLSTEDIKSVNKGVGVELATYLGDDLWSHEKL